MDDKKFLILLSVFAVVSLVLVLGLGAVVVLDAKSHKDDSSVSYGSRGNGAAGSDRAPLRLTE